MVLMLSNAKRIGVALSVGRVGLPINAPSKAVNVDCSEYFHQLNSDNAVQDIDQTARLGSFDHSWHIGNEVFVGDLFETLKGDLDRAGIPARRVTDTGRLILIRGSGTLPALTRTGFSGGTSKPAG